jgi:MFS family permease
MVIVNTVVIVRGLLGRPDTDVAVALGCFGGGSMVTALLLPRIFDRVPDRRVMIPAATFLGAVLLILAVPALSGATLWPALLAGWALLGLGYSAILTPTGRLLRRSAHASDRPALFAAQFALSHACWLVTYPLAGWLGTAAGIAATLVLLGALTFIGAGLAILFWPADDPETVPHAHPELGADHPHIRDAHTPAHCHAHAFVIDDLHHRWPAAAGGK